MRLMVLIAFIGLLFSFTPSQAQTDAIDPSLIFVPPLEIRHVASPPQEELPYAWDDDLKLFEVDGVISPYPDRVKGIHSIEQVDVNTFTFAYVYAPDVHPDDVAWVYSRTQHTLTSFSPVCGETGGLANGWYLSRWLWIIVEQNDTTYLCNRLTGEKSDPLPVNYQWKADYWNEPGYIITISPDWRYVAFIGDVGLELQSEYSRDVEVFSFDTQTRKFLSIGTMGAGSSLYFEEWVGNQVTIANGESNNIGSMGIFVADVTKADSLVYALGDSGGASPVFADNPPRYFTGYGANSPVPCGQRTYYVETHQLVELHLDGLCHPEYGDIAGVGYYRDVPFGENHECCTAVPADVAEVPLIRYDARTGERKELYTAEIEHIYWVSPDDHYAILLIDQNKHIDFFPYLQDYDTFSNLGYPSVELIDLQKQQPLTILPIYELFQAQSLDEYMRDWAINHSITRMSDGTFVEIICYHDIPVGCGRVGNAALRLTVTDDELKEILLVDNPIMLTPDKTGLFVWSQPPSRERGTPTRLQGVNIYDLNTGTISPFIQELNPAHYNFELHISGDNSVNVAVEDRLLGAKQNFNVYFESGQPAYIQIVDPPPPSIGKYVCVLMTQTGVNLRVGPAGNVERAGTAKKGEKLLAIGQEVSAYDGLVWWQLDKGGWVRSDFVTPTSACDTLPDTNPNATPAPGSPGSTPDGNLSQPSGLACNLTVLTGANLRSGPGVEFDKVGNAAANQTLTADGQFANVQDFFTWWRLITGEWVREDFVAEDTACAALPQITP